MKKLLLLLLLLANISSASAQSPAYGSKFRLIDLYMDSLMKEWNIPGLALVIVHKDQAIFSKGYGYRDLEKKLPVDHLTLFPIASNTKLFTATAAAMLAGEGKLSLDKPVHEYLPTLVFSNDELNAKVTLRDMLSHRTGLPRYDGIWVASPFSRAETVEKVTYMKPTLGFRHGYIYNNMMFAAAGAVLEKITGKSWEEIIREKILQPLQMSSSCFTNEEMKTYGNFAVSYFEPDSSSKLQPMSFAGQSSALGPAGTIKSNTEDMSHWMIAQLNNGMYQGRQVIAASAISETMKPNSIADTAGRWEELSNALYGLGRMVQSYKGFKITSHTGSIDGFYSNLTFIPSEKIAVFIVHNGVPGGSIRSMMAFPVIDRLLSLSYTPWSARYRKDYLEEKKNTKRNRDSINATQVPNTSTSHPLKDYSGNYANPVYGNISIELNGGELSFSFRSQKAKLHHFHYDQFITREEKSGSPDFRLTFITDSRGMIESIRMRPFNDPAVDFVKQIR